MNQRKAGKSAAFKGEGFELTNCLLLDGVNDYVTLASNLGGLQTMQFWVKFAAKIAYNPFFCVPSSTNWGTWTNGTWFYLAAGTYNGATTISFALNTAYHVVFKYNSATTKWEIFINSTKYIITTSLANSVNVFKDLGRNFSNSGITAYSNAKFAEIAHWDTELSDADIASLYNSGLGDYATNFSPANLQMYWRMNEASGTTAADFSGNTRNGTLTNMSGTEWTTW